MLYSIYIQKEGLVNIVTRVVVFIGSASSWERSVGSLYHKFQKAQFEDPPHSKSLILSNYWQFQLFLFVFLITSFLQMDWLTQLMENNNGFLEQLTLDQWSPCVVDYCCCCSQLVHPCEERKKRLVPNTLLPLVLELVTLVVVKMRVLSQTHSPDHKKKVLFSTLQPLDFSQMVLVPANISWTKNPHFKF